jgi:hypothetical protein
MRIYIACPYTHGDQAENVRASITAAEGLAAKGHAPYNPLWSHFWEIFYHHEYAFWIEQDLEWLAQCQAVVRLPGRSAGADAEVEFARTHGLPVFYSLDEVPGEST